MNNYNGYQIVNETLKYLNELTATTKYITKSALNNPIFMKNLARLKRAGMIKPEKRYVAGLQKGTSNILNKYGTKEIIHPAAKMTGGSAAMIPASYKQAQSLSRISGTPQLYKDIANIPQGAKSPLILKSKKAPKYFSRAAKQFGTKSTIKQATRDMPIIRRHEADEIRSMTKNNMRGAPLATTIWTKKLGNKKLPINIPIGQHASPKVLQREKDITDYTTKAYRNKGGSFGGTISRMRDTTGEHNLVNKLGQKGISKFERQVPRLAQNVEVIPGSKIKANAIGIDTATGKPVTNLNQRIKILNKKMGLG